MTQPKLAHATQWGRMYGRRIGDQPQVPSITTVLGEAADTLHWWHGREAAKAMKAWHAGGDAADAYPHVAAAAEQAREKRRNVESAVLKACAETGRFIADAAAERGDRVHDYAEQVARWRLGSGTRAEVTAARERLAERGEEKFADQFDNWWMRFDVQPVFAEATVWHHDAGYAGTIDIGFRSNGLLVVGDYKSKETSWGRAKSLDAKVGMQLVAGMNAQEYCVEPVAGEWAPWKWGAPDLLVGIAVADCAVESYSVRRADWEQLWVKFQRLRQVWQSHHDLDLDGALVPLRPPPSAAGWPDEHLVPLADLPNAS
jgi:hypothetical protein